MARRTGMVLSFCAAMAVLPACRDSDAARALPQPAAMRPDASASQDRLPPPVNAPLPDGAPFATAQRARVEIRESITRHGEPLQVGSIEVPEHWRITGRDEGSAEPCPYWTRCVLWQAVSPDGASRIMLLSPRRSFEEAGKAGEGSPQARIAGKLLRDIAGEGEPHGIVAQSGPLAAGMQATRRGWSTAAAWLSIAYDAFGTRTQEFTAIEVETQSLGRRLHRVQGGPLLVLRMPADRFDIDAADAVRRSLRVDAAWFAQWWLAWEIRTIRQACTRGYHRGDCHVQEGAYTDYFRSGDSLGLWDIRSAEPYASPDIGEQRYDP